MFLQIVTVHIHFNLLCDYLLAGLIKVKTLFVAVIDTLEARPLFYGPAERKDVDVEFLLEFIQQFKGILAFAVHLIGKDDDRSFSHAAYLHQLARLRLHALGRVNNDDNAIDSRQRAEGIFGKVLVARGIENVYLVSLIVELHHGSRHRDTTLFLNLHPVGGCRLADFVRFDSTSHLYLSAKKQQLFCQRRLTRIRMRDNCKCSPAGYFIFNTHNSLIHSFRLTVQ